MLRTTSTRPVMRRRRPRFARFTFQDVLLLVARDMATVHGEGRLRQFPSALATALAPLPTARRDPIGNAICACNFTPPRTMLALLFVADAPLPGELPPARCA
eukprot:1428711-Pyramimonas_sp.AAC.1